MKLLCFSLLLNVKNIKLNINNAHTYMKKNNIKAIR